MTDVMRWIIIWWVQKNWIMNVYRNITCRVNNLYSFNIGEALLKFWLFSDHKKKYIVLDVLHGNCS